jgi:hypothetical protein
MNRSWLLRIKEFMARFSRKPWCVFETGGPDATGRLAFSIYYNQAFIENLTRHGLSGTTEEETVQLFFLQLRMLPEGLLQDEDVVSPEATPTLTHESSRLVRG